MRFGSGRNLYLYLLQFVSKLLEKVVDEFYEIL